MASSKPITTGIKPKNKLRRSAAYLSIKKAKESAKRDARFKRKREEDKDPSLREERRSQNVPVTIDAKRVWDDEVGDEEDMLGWAIDVERAAKKRKLAEEEAERNGEEGILAKLKQRDAEAAGEGEGEDDELDDEVDSMLASEDEEDQADGSDSEDRPSRPKQKAKPAKRAPSPSTSTATDLTLSPEFLKSKFPAIFNPAPEPKILVETHHHADILTSLFPNSTYIRRTAHAHAHKYSVREIAQFATARGYTNLVILSEALHLKLPDGLEIITLPSGPHFHFSISNWVDSKKLPGHGNPTGHLPELILNQFRTPLGILTAQLFRSLYPPSPELEGRTVVTLHNQRDYIFVRRHRYVFRDKRSSEKSIVGTDGKVVKGVEDIKAGLQELGPRFTLKLRRVDRGVQWKSGQEWQWKGKMEKQRTRFAM
ncbi:anticodon-binding protein [Lophiotrema nucula]|uniref:Anticodon-binding protein n=1 Tax=Lophiotrema nucula TaxID=690887 RepID=A0A6A5Z701_9PLEO|nr:anticodon-binding protein [Lophiotrema nucula]